MNNFYGVQNSRTPSNELQRSLSAPQQRLPAFNPLQAKIQSLHQTSLVETMESMSLVMGTRLRQLNGRRNGVKDSSPSLREEFKNLLPEVESSISLALIDEFSDLVDSEKDPLQYLQESDVPPDAKLPLLATLIRSGQLNAKKRKRLEAAMDSLLTEEDITLGFFAWFDLGNIKPENLLSLKKLYQRIKKDDSDSEHSLNDLFKEICEWSEPLLRIKVLIKALATDLRAGLTDNIDRVASTIYQLKRLLIFLGISEVSTALAYNSGIDDLTVLQEVLSLFDQAWISSQWILERMSFVGVNDASRQLWLNRISELVKLSPEPCFLDDSHQEQIISAIKEVMDELNF